MFVGFFLRSTVRMPQHRLCTSILLYGLFLATESSAESSGAHGRNETGSCSSMKVAWGTQGLGSQMVPQSPINGDQLRVCSQYASTCCTRQMEVKIVGQGKQTLSRTIAEKIGIIRSTFATKTNRYAAFCNDLIDRSSQGLHEMFLKTYGNIYLQNTKIFSEFFRELRSYLRGGSVDLSDMIDSFFSRLTRQMFILCNSQYVIDESFTTCFDSQIANMSPLGDVPQQLGVQLKRAFIAARAFHQGLIVGRDTLAAVFLIEPSQSCINAVTRMLYCPYCRGIAPAGLKPCNGLCMNVMRGCFAQLYELNDAWNVYLDAMTKVAGRLEGPFNIEGVVGPIDINLSNAIMNFQDNAETLSEKIFQICGRPNLAIGNARQKRSAPPNPAAPGAGVGGGGAGGRRGSPDDTSSSDVDEDRLETLIADIHDHLLTTQDFWRSLPDAVCNNMAARQIETSNCWNGVNKARYTSNLVSNGLLNQLNNSEVNVDVNRKNAYISKRLAQLRAVTSKLTNAHKGLEVDWSDTRGVDDDDDEDSEGSASGENDDVDQRFSGSGGAAVGGGGVDYFEASHDPGLSFTRPAHPQVEVVTRRHPVPITHATQRPIYYKPTSTSKPSCSAPSKPFTTWPLVVATLSVFASSTGGTLAMFLEQR